MGSKYPVLPPNDVIKVLKKLGFNQVSQRGSHAKFKNTTDPIKTVIVPMHSEIAKGTLKSILEQANTSIDEFLNLL